MMMRRQSAVEAVSNDTHRQNKSRKLTMTSSISASLSSPSLNWPYLGTSQKFVYTFLLVDGAEVPADELEALPGASSFFKKL